MMHMRKRKACDAVCMASIHLQSVAPGCAEIVHLGLQVGRESALLPCCPVLCQPLVGTTAVVTCHRHNMSADAHDPGNASRAKP